MIMDLGGRLDDEMVADCGLDGIDLGAITTIGALEFHMQKGSKESE